MLAAFVQHNIGWADNTTIGELYRGQVLVDPAAPASESALVRRAFLAMLVKLTGHGDPTNLPGISDHLNQAMDMVSRVGYESYLIPEGLSHNANTQPFSRHESRRFVADFIPERVDNWLRQHQVARWSPDRSPIQLWLAIEENLERRFITPQDETLVWVIRDTAEARGLPWQWPEQLPEPRHIAKHGEFIAPVDRTAEAAMINALWGGFYEELPPPHDLLLLAAARQLHDHWQIRWRLLENGELNTFTSTETTITDALSAGIDEAARRLAGNHLIQPNFGNERALRIHVSNIHDNEDYGRLMLELRQLSQVDAIHIQRAATDWIQMELEARAGRDWLLGALSINNVLQAEEMRSDGPVIYLRLTE